MADEAASGSDLMAALRARLSPAELSSFAQIAGSLAGETATGAEASESSSYQAVLATLLPTLTDQRRLLQRQRQQAPLLLEELLRVPSERRRMLLDNSPRFHCRPLCDLLHQRSLDACFRRPEEAVELAHLAIEVADRLPVEVFGESAACDEKARSWAFLGNAHRVAGDPRLAEEALETAQGWLEQGSGDLLEVARLKTLRANLRGSQRRFEEALGLFDQAARIYRQCGEDHMLGRSLLDKAVYHGYAGEPELAVDLLRRGLALVEPEREPRLVLAASHNLVLYLTDLGRHEEAAALLDSTRPLYRQLGDRISLLRLRWLEARMARERRELQQAEAAFLETREAFVQEGILWDVALVSLDLAAIYTEQGRTSRILKLANELVPLFQATGMHREALAALILFHQAAQAERVSQDLIRRLTAQLRSLRRDR